MFLTQYLYARFSLLGGRARPCARIRYFNAEPNAGTETCPPTFRGRLLRKFHHQLSFAAVIAALATTIRAAQPAPPTLWYTQPAAKWTDALPVGNGHLGAMVFGGLLDERIQFNESTLWTGRPHDYVRAGAGDALPEIRRLLLAGEQAAAQKLAKEKFISDPDRQKAYQPFGDLRLHIPGHETATDYRRELDLDSAVARVSYRIGDTVFRREAFASHPDNVLVVRLTADHPGGLTFSLGVSSPHKSAHTTSLGPDTLVLTGEVEPGGLRFESRTHALVTGGHVTNRDGVLTVEAADTVTLLVVAATSFKTYEDISADPSARCTEALAAVDRKWHGRPARNGFDYDSLLAAHLADHRSLFRRVALNLGTTDRARLPTDQRLAEVRRSGLDGDPALAALHFAYGRYLLIASSRPGGQPANLQGIWNEELAPPWDSKWTTNVNVEMNYWPTEVANLSECHTPLFDLIDDLAVSGARTAREQYGASGWVLHHNTDLWRATAPVNGLDGIWPTGGAWLCFHLWEHWLFTGDREFLARRAYPAMKSAAQFFADTLVKDQKTGWLVTFPSYSPEQDAAKHVSLVAGPTMDNQLVRALFTSVIEAAAELKIDQAFAEKISALRDQLPPNQIGRHGQLQEWLDDVDRPNNAHRHMSPLWALYPGADITPADPKVFAAAKTLLGWRGEGSTGWSYAWRIPLWARVGDGEFAYRQFSRLVTNRTLPNLFDLCGPFQIDGNFGATAGLAEMLLQSHQFTSRPAGVPIIDLLPALPHAWPAGNVTGLCARGGFEVELAWRDGALTRVVVRSKLGRPCRIRYRDRTLDLATSSGQTFAFDGDLRPLR